MQSIKIGNMDFDYFKRITEKNEKIYQKNLKSGSKLKKLGSKDKFAWSSSADEFSVEEYHRNVTSFDLAFDRVMKCHMKRMKSWWKVEEDELNIIGSSPFGEEHDWNNKILTKEDVRKIVELEGKFVFRMEFKGKDEEKKGCRQEWSSIYTMEGLDKEENGLKEQFQKEAQDQADRTGERAEIVNMVGWKFVAEPRKK
jgi:hypothetical protein